MLKKLCPRLYALSLVCSLNLIVEIAPYSGILCLNGWTYNSFPLILVLCSFQDFYLSLYKRWQALLSVVIFHQSIIQKLIMWKQIFLNKTRNQVSEISLLAIPIVINSYLTFVCLAWDFNNLKSIFSLLIIFLYSMHLWQSIPIFLSRASCDLPSSL